jgi:hypothetical protein
MAKDKDEPETTTWINDKYHKSPDSEGANQKPEQALEQVIGGDKAKEKPALAAHPAAASPEVMAEKIETPSPAATAEDKTPQKLPEKTAEKIAEKIISKREPPKASLFIPVHAPVKKAAGHTGALKVQLGAYRSEQEAREAWSAMQQTHAVLSGYEPMIVKADLGSRGVYYRLRVGGFSSAADMKSFCGKLAPQPCLPAN